MRAFQWNVVPCLARVNEKDEIVMITTKREKKGKRDIKMKLGRKWKGSNQIKVIGSVFCTRFYMVE